MASLICGNPHCQVLSHVSRAMRSLRAAQLVLSMTELTGMHCMLRTGSPTGRQAVPCGQAWPWLQSNAHTFSLAKRPRSLTTQRSLSPPQSLSLSHGAHRGLVLLLTQRLKLGSQRWYWPQLLLSRHSTQVSLSPASQTQPRMFSQ